jgi:polyisoprenoid-binding protein YceI
MKIKSFNATPWLLALAACVSADVADAQSVNSGAAQSGSPSNPAPPLATPPLFVLDPSETHSRFEVKFLGLMMVRGKFNRTTGNLYHDPAGRDAASRASDSIYAEIDATTLDTHVINSHATNEILRGPQFFNVEKFPAITFKSSVFNWDETSLKSIEGSLTLLGVSKPVTLTVEKSGCAPATVQKRARCTAEAFVNVKRADFGMKAWAASVSNDVKLTIELVAYQASDANNESKNKSEAAANPLLVPSTPVTPPANEPRL